MRRRRGRSWRSGEPRDTRRRAGAEAARAPIVVSRQENNTQRVSALCAQAEALNLKRGMGVAEARAMHPGIEIVEADPTADLRLLEALADWCDRYTPLVALDGAEGLFLDIAGCAHLFGGERALLDDILLRLSDQGFDARGAIAPTPGSAWAAARFASPALIAPGMQAEALAPLPLAALRLEPQLRAALQSVGLRSVGQVMAAPRAPLARRFGKGLLMRLDQALGVIEEAVSPRLPVAPLSVERILAEPIVTVEAVENLLPPLAESLKRDLERRGEGARLIQLTLFRVDGAVHRYRVGTARPMRSPGRMARLFHERLAAGAEDLDVGYGFELVRLSALQTARFEIEQTDLAGEREAGETSLAFLADRVAARLGSQALFRPVPVESHIPERAVAMACFADAALTPMPAAPMPAAPWPAAMSRPLRLLPRPEAIEVFATEVPEGPPLNFRWRRLTHRIASAEGPERIAPEWWRAPVDTPARDYFRVEDQEGRRYWVYREGSYDADTPMPRWFMQGIFP